MSDWVVFRRIVVEELFRLMALEVVIGLPPVGIADAIGVDEQLLFVIAGISLSVPLVICVLMIVIRTREKEEQAQGRAPWQMDKRTWIAIGVGTIVTLSLVLLYSRKGLISDLGAVASVLITFLWIGMAAWFTLHAIDHNAT
jgi:heme/copper-type cytochrome/quinol oxidase subunit 2